MASCGCFGSTHRRTSSPALSQLAATAVARSAPDGPGLQASLQSPGAASAPCDRRSISRRSPLLSAQEPCPISRPAQLSGVPNAILGQGDVSTVYNGTWHGTSTVAVAIKVGSRRSLCRRGLLASRPESCCLRAVHPARIGCGAPVPVPGRRRPCARARAHAPTPAAGNLSTNESTESMH